MYRKEIWLVVMIKLSLALLIHILSHLSGPGLAMAPVQDEYRIEMMQKRIDRLLKWKMKGILKGWKLDGEKTIWR